MLPLRVVLTIVIKRGLASASSAPAGADSIMVGCASSISCSYHVGAEERAGVSGAAAMRKGGAED
jgi:hypothetical protein